ncbi:hypothetical protein GCM10017767_21230 [Halomonas urumqiensis]|nr:hypothetical protein GCM10017767_21230 [Halomonas urumqiensis]
MDLVHAPDDVEPTSESARQLTEENARLRRICAALIERVESGGVVGGAPYAAFEHSVLLAEQVRERTETLQRTLGELHRAKAEAEAANLSKTKFLAAVSHDLLQPLNAARLFTSALDEHALPEPSRRVVGHIGRSLKDVETLLGTLVDISRLDAGVLTPDIAPFRVGELLDVLAEEYRQIAAAQGLELRYVPNDTLIESDLALLARVVRNFLSNAIRYTERGRILLGCRRHPEGLDIMVGDTGPGIAEEQREAIFEEFRRIGGDREDRGLGLGLAIVDRISGMLGHPLRLRSCPGRGSVFAVRVPYARTKVAQRHDPERIRPASDRLAGATVWVIDNDADIREGMQALLGGWGCEVVTAASLEQLDARANGQHADVLLVDYHLAEGDPDGLEVASHLQARQPGLPVVVITANHAAELKAEARRKGHDCLLKPLKPLRLRMLLATLLEARANAPARPQR